MHDILLESMPPGRMTLVEDWRQDDRQGVLSIRKRQRLLHVHVPHDAHTVEIAECPRLDSIYVHPGVTFIALEDVGLSELNLPNGVRQVLLRKCKKLKKLVLPDSVWEVTIEGCEALEDLTLSKGVTHLKITNCPRLANIDLPTGVKPVTFHVEVADLAEVTVPATVRGLHLSGLARVQRITIPDGTQTVHLSYCYGVEEVVIPASVTKLTVHEGPDYNARIRDKTGGLQRVVFLGNATTDIDLSHCCFLTGITLPACAQRVNLQFARQIKALSVPEGVEDLNLNGCAQLTSLTMPSTVQKLKLCWCDNLSTVLALPQGIQEADLGYSGITGVTIPSGSTLAQLDLRYCGNITELTIPQGIRITGQLSVTHCSKLTKLAVLGDRLARLNIFECHALTDLTVPEGTVIDWWLQQSNLKQYTCGGKVVTVEKAAG